MAFEELRKSDAGIEAILFPMEQELPYYQEKLPQFVSGNVSLDQMYYRHADSYSHDKIQVIFDTKISRVNFNRKRVFTESKKQYDFDVIFITDTGSDTFPDIKGTNKLGVFSLSRLSHMRILAKDLALIETIVIESDTQEGLEMAQTLVDLGKEVLLVTATKKIIPVNETASQEGISGQNLGEEIQAQENQKESFEEKKVRIVEETSIMEVLGDSDVKAVKLKSGKVFATQVVIFGNIQKDMRLFKDTGLSINEGIVVDEKFRAGIEGVFAFGNACVSSLASNGCRMEDQGEAIAAVIQGQKLEDSVSAPEPVTEAPAPDFEEKDNELADFSPHSQGEWNQN